MSKQQHNRFFQKFEPHTVFKHLVLEYYVASWFQKVVRGLGITEAVVVDAFAGEGLDRAGQAGSPVRLARAAVLARATLERDLDRPVHLRVIAIEQDVGRYGRLADHLEAFGEGVEVLPGTLGDHLAGILDRHAGQPSLFFLDPFGVKGLEADTMAQVLDADGNEVFVLFNDPGADRLAGAARAAASASPQVMLELETQVTEGDSPEDGPPWSRTGDEAREILNVAFGSSDWERGLTGDVSAHRRREILIKEYERLLQGIGARYTTKIPVRDASGGKRYTLMHASWSMSGRVTMKRETIRALKACDLPDRVKDMIRMGTATDLAAVEAAVLRHFAGTIAFWAERNNPSVQIFALGETPIFPHQLKELQGRLRQHQTPERIITYRFPDAPTISRG